VMLACADDPRIAAREATPAKATIRIADLISLSLLRRRQRTHFAHHK